MTAGLADHQGLLRECLHHAEHVAPCCPASQVDHALDVLEPEPTDEHRQQAKQPLLLCRQQPIAPVEGGAHGALPLR